MEKSGSVEWPGHCSGTAGEQKESGIDLTFLYGNWMDSDAMTDLKNTEGDAEVDGFMKDWEWSEFSFENIYPYSFQYKLRGKGKYLGNRE